jgi:hypothetical protein
MTRLKTAGIIACQTQQLFSNLLAFIDDCGVWGILTPQRRRFIV